ncbi:MAG: DEAD/DEAH box helicase family protein, partial [Candidatus Ancillula sp.]|nr:DEAD/DEAH box helicase family protein [Candidatus Ancillula sp.]
FGNIEGARFIYESTGVKTHFRDKSDEISRPREVFNFHQPETLHNWLQQEERGDNTLKNRLIHNFPNLDMGNFRQCQFDAITNLEQSFAENKPRALIQMATGAGKTYTAISEVYRLLKFAKAKRILFLVDTRNLGKQAMQEFSSFRPQDDTRLFTELYSVHSLKKSYMPDTAQVCISTIQRMYSMLKGKELDESLEEGELTKEQEQNLAKELVEYNQQYPPEFFDFIIIDECHRSIYNVWQQVLDYFDAFQIGLTATPDNRTFGYFKQNVVSEYTHEQAVIDGVNVQGEIYRVKTEITDKGAKILEQEVLKRDRKTREQRWEENDEEISYSSNDLDRSVVNESQIRTVLTEFKNNLPRLFPNRYPNDKETCPKTLIFAKDDSHADDIIRICLEVFNQGSEFCKKITYRADNAEEVLNDFRNAYNPRIAVTVNMIATGTDVKPLECLIFMRDVKSKNYYEQMMGRGTRTQGFEQLRLVSPSALHNKDRFILIDAVGVTESKKLDSRPLERKPSISLKDLMMSVATGDHSEDTLTTLASRLISLDRVVTDKERQELQDLANGKQVSRIAADMLNAFDEDYKVENKLSSEEEINQFINLAVLPVSNPDFRNCVLEARRIHDQIIDTENIDKVVFSDWQSNSVEQANDIVKRFEEYIRDNDDKLDALQIIYSQSYRDRPLLLDQINQLHSELTKLGLNEEKIWGAYYSAGRTQNKPVEVKLVDLIQLVKFGYGQISELTTFGTEVARKFKAWIFKAQAAHSGDAASYSEEQMNWLRLIRDFIAISVNISDEDLDNGEFAKLGGLSRFYELFGDSYQQLLAEMNFALAA